MFVGGRLEMIKYFKYCQNLEDLRNEYHTLIKKYHPDLAKDEFEFKQLNEKCAEINEEYEQVLKRFPKTREADRHTNHGTYEYIINGSEEARSAYSIIMDQISKLTIDYNFYHKIDAKWWEDYILNEINSNIRIFWDVCLTKKIIGDEFAKLFELCNFNVEKMRRTIMFLNTGAISDKDIHTNLTSDCAIPFFDDNIIVEKIPTYSSFLLLSRADTKEDTIEAWIEFCQRQRDNFLEKFADIVIPKISSGKQK